MLQALTCCAGAPDLAALGVGGAARELLENAVRAIVLRVMDRLHDSILLDGPRTEGRLKIVGGCYDLEDGVEDFFES